LDFLERVIQPLSLDKVKINDNFWAPRITLNHDITLHHVLKKCEKTGRIDNFSRAAGLLDDGKKPIFPFDDSDVFKVIEGVSYSLIIKPDLELEKYVDDLIEKIAAAQEDDGYLYTTRTINPANPHVWAGKKRWELVSVLSHELYNMGHLIEAGIGYYQATGKRRLLDVAIKCADLINREFGPGKLERIPGHQEIELALIRLFGVTNNKKYLDLAKFFLDIRGSTKAFDFEDYLTKFKIHFEDAISLEYNQSHKRIIEQDEAVGHAVRAVYMYSAMTDIISIYNDPEYNRAINRIWSNIVSKKLYITGGIGSRSAGESFGDNYDLPNFEAYAETCAAIANMFWNYRLFLLYGDAKFIDIFERILYNGFLSGISLNGKKFFYINPLASRGNVYRRSWWKCPCCPTNIVRFLPQIPRYIYGIKDNTIFINLFIGNSANIPLENSEISISQETNYPWEGRVKITINLEDPFEFTIAIRIPGWSQNKPIPSDLYHYLRKNKEKVSLKINNTPYKFITEKDFANIHRIWQNNDIIEVEFPMPIRRVIAHEQVNENVGKVALEKGPIVYCIESVDNDIDSIFNLFIDDKTDFDAEVRKDLLGEIILIKGNSYNDRNLDKGEDISKSYQNFIMIPYYSWSNRGKSQMAVWIGQDFIKP